MSYNASSAGLPARMEDVSHSQGIGQVRSWLERVAWADPFIKPWMIDLSDDHYALDISRARTLLGWEPRHSLRNTLPTMLNDLKSDPAGWYQENDLRVQPIPDGPPWPHVANMLLGLWLIGTAPALGMTVPALLWSDLASGAAVILFSALAMRHAWAAWTVCGVVCGDERAAIVLASNARSTTTTCSPARWWSPLR